MEPELEPDTITDDNAETAVEDQDFDNLDDAVDALADDDEQADEVEPDDEAEPEQKAASVVLSDGTTLTLDEVEKGYLRQSDYTRKNTEVAEERGRLETAKTGLITQAQTLHRAQQRLDEFVMQLIPADPPASLAASNSAQFVRQQAERQAAIREIQKLLDVSGDISAAMQGVSETDVKLRTDQETAALVKAMPALKDPVRKAAFDKAVADTATHFGFTPEELAATVDHRVLRAMHFASIGVKADQNRKNAARRVEAPRRGAVPAAANASAGNKEAMSRFKKEPTISNAVKHLNF